MIDLFQEIINTLKQNKLRTILTGFAVSWGIFILIALLGISNGMFNAFEQSSNMFDQNSIIIFRGFTTMPIQGFDRGRAINFDQDDIDLLSNKLSDRLTNGGGRESLRDTEVSTVKDYIISTVQAVYPSYQLTEALQIKQGRFITDLDIKLKRKVIVLYDEAAFNLFGLSDPIGQQVTINNLPYVVIGILEGGGFKDTRDTFIPYSTMKLIYNKEHLSQLNFVIKNIHTKEDCKALEKDISNILAIKHTFHPDDKGAFFLWNRFEQHLEMQQATKYFTIMIWVIGILTLISGVVGVGNIMLISVKERTKEFGIRKALGAKPWSILKLVILESIFITTLFGYIGLLLGIAATEWIDKIAGEQVIDMGAFQRTVFLNPSVDLNVAIQATLAMIIAGTMAGFMPAKRAVSIKPIEALNAK